jgi:hypothetical protein
MPRKITSSIRISGSKSWMTTRSAHNAAQSITRDAGSGRQDPRKVTKRFARPAGGSMTSFRLAPSSCVAPSDANRRRRSFAWRGIKRKPKRASIRSTALSRSRRMLGGSSSIRQTSTYRAGSAKPWNVPSTAASTKISMKADTSYASIGRQESSSARLLASNHWKQWSRTERP